MGTWRKWASKKEELTDYEELQKKKERRIKVNGADPEVNPYCDCGAKHDREFPNVHSRWCIVYRPV